VKTVTHTFQEVAVRVAKQGKCEICGKRVKRSTTFRQTLNPWNINANGDVKTETEIYAELRGIANEWAAYVRCTDHERTVR
jgi:hypothetical protein